MSAMFDGNDCLLKVSGITKRLHDYFALRDISVNLNRGEVHVILGENGAGKTTLVRLLTGDITPDRGNISILGKEVKIKNPQHARSLGISVAHQDFVLFPEMSVVATLFLFQDPRRGSLSTSNMAVERAGSFLSELDFLAKVDLRDKVKNLSAGQRKQLQIASAIIQDSPIVILDDPASYLSDEERACLFEVINRLKNQGKGIIYACHRVDEAKRVADRVIVLRDGEIATSIEEKSLVSSANLLRGMIGVIFRLRAAPGLPIERVSTNVELELGYKPEALMGSNSLYEDIINQDDRQKAENLRRQFAEQNVDHFEREYRIVCATGEHRWIHELAHVIRDNSDAITSYEIGIVDITEARRAQETLRQSEQKYESLVNNIANVIYSSMPGVSGTRIFLSPRWEDWTGQSIHDIYRDQQMWLRAVHSEDVAKITKVYLEASTKGTDYCIEYRLVHKNSGQVRYIRDHGMPIKEESGRLVMFDGIISDITEIKNLELELRQSREFLSELIMNAPVPILVFNKDHSVRYANPALERLTGFTSSGIISCGFPYPWYVDKQQHRPLGDLTSPREELYQKKNGDRFWVEIASVIVKGQLHEKFFLETWNDITKEKQFTENLRSYANLVTNALEDERKRLARELHDGTIQSLFCLCTDIGNCIKDSNEINALASYGKLGLVGMNERAYLIGGTLSIDSKKDKGTIITVQVPRL